MQLIVECGVWCVVLFVLHTRVHWRVNAKSDDGCSVELKCSQFRRNLADWAACKRNERYTLYTA